MSRRLSFRGVLLPSGLAEDRAIRIGEDGRIAAVEPGGPPYDGFLALPGMPNAHSHVFQRALSGHGEGARGDESFWSWREAMYRLAASIDPETSYAVARYAYADMLRAGFTHVAEFHYVHHLPDGAATSEMADAVLRAAADAGLPISFLPVYYRTSGFDGAPATAGQRRFVHDGVESFLAFVAGLGGRVAGIAPHSLRAVPRDELEPLVAGAREILGPDAPLHIHVSEQEAEVASCREVHGATPIDLLADTVELDGSWNLVHATHATPGELDRVRAAGARVVLCPLTEAYLGDGIFAARDHLEAGGEAAVGSDSNARVSAVGEVRTLEYGQRLRDRRRARLADASGSMPRAWNWLARGGGRAVGRPLGRIEAGARADLVVLAEEGPAIRGHAVATAADAWLVGGDERDVEGVYVGGERRVERGTVAGEDAVSAAFDRAMRSLWR